ncbi:putative dipeptidyl-aminopeptidase B [Kalaharituber pfeilii]|nr:putative dipeptidyl-aminopeptidase B [Kalaharituber pfeilii]
MASSSYQQVAQRNDDDDDSIESTSTTSLILERINNADAEPATKREPYDDPDHHGDHHDANDDDEDLEAGRIGEKPVAKPVGNNVKKMVYIIGALLVGGWCLALIVYLASEYNAHDTAPTAEPSDTANLGKLLRLGSIMGGEWRPYKHDIEWVAGADGKKDGLMLTQNYEAGGTRGWLVIEDLKGDKNKPQVLMKSRSFSAGGRQLFATRVWPSPDLKKVLVATDTESKFRHSYTAKYWIYDVESQSAVPLIPKNGDARCSLAIWSPQSNAIAYVINNNVYIRRYPEEVVLEVSKDGGTDLFYGIPDWVYEEEVFAGNKAMWWSDDGSYLALLRTNETEVPEYPIQFFVSRPSGESPKPGLESYPEIELIKYPKAGAPNPIVELLFWDMKKVESFSVRIDKDFPDDQRLITEVLWAGGNKVLVRETNRESDVLKMVLIDVKSRSGKVVREQDVAALDGGWFEVVCMSQETRFIPADPSKGRTEDGYIDTVIHEGFNHLAYFTPVDSDKPRMLTTGKWEVDSAPSAVDLEKNIIYFLGTKESSIQRHVYSVKLDGSGFKAITNTSDEGKYGVSFSKKGGFALLTYNGPGVPWQKVIGTESGDPSFEQVIEDNDQLAALVVTHALPTFHYSTVKIDDVELNVVERRPPNFNPKKKYPVLFYVYGGPGSQTVSKSFNIDFQAYVAGNLGYIVVSVDGRGTGFIGRKARCAVRGDLGHYEARDQIETAKIWKAKPYVDPKRIAIWGWSFGGFMTLKTLEQDAGQTFSYGMAVAPVTDWRFYDSIYTERYMHTPQNNPKGYQTSAVNNVTALAQNVRFLLMHGVADDNVHMQNSLTLLDKLDLGSVENYDVHVFPDSDHSIYFHNANRMVYDRLATWLMAAFNGEFLKWQNMRPKEQVGEYTGNVDGDDDDHHDKTMGRGRGLLKKELKKYEREIAWQRRGVGTRVEKMFDV